jgi:hypothetical protein
MLKLLFLFVIPIVLWFYSMLLVPYIPGDDLALLVYGVPGIPILLLGAFSFFGFREAKHERFNPTSPFLGITSEMFVIRNSTYRSEFEKHNPSIRVSPASSGLAFTPSGAFTTGVKSGFLISALAILLVGMLLVGGLPNPDTGPTITSIKDINDGEIDIGTVVTVVGTVDATSETWISITGDGGAIFIIGTGQQPSIGITITVTGTVATTTTIIDVTSLEYS